MRRRVGTLGALLFTIAGAGPALAAQPPPDVTITVVDNPGQLDERVNTLSLPPSTSAAASSKEKPVGKSKAAGQHERAGRTESGAAPAPAAAAASTSPHAQASKSTRTEPANTKSDHGDASSGEAAAKGTRSGDSAAEERQNAQPDTSDGAEQDQSDNERQNIEQEPQPGTDAHETQDGPQNQQSDTQGGQPPSQPPSQPPGPPTAGASD